MDRKDEYLERLLPSQLLSGGGALLVNTIKHPGLRLEEEKKINQKEKEAVPTSHVFASVGFFGHLSCVAY